MIQRPRFGDWELRERPNPRMKSTGLDIAPQVRHVLVVEDCDDDVEMVRYALLGDPVHRYRFSEAGSVAAARRLLDSGQAFDLMILDWRLADGDSGSLIRELKSDEAVPKLPIILLTTSEDPEVQREVHESGVQDYFTKETLLPSILPRIASNAIERHRLMRELWDQRQTAHEAQRRAEESSRAKSAFLTGMSHELRTPLTAIVGLADLLLEEPKGEDVPQMLEMIRANGQHLTQLLGDLLDLAKIEIGRTSVSKVDCSVISITRDLCDLMRHRANDDGLQLSLAIEPSFPEVVSTDPVRYRQILMNLISNSIKYSGQGTIDVALRTSPDCLDQFEVEVKDTGPGIAPELQSVLFMPFVQRDPNAAGVGLGLSISRSLATALGGTLSFVPPAQPVAAGENLGSTFVLKLPLGNLNGKSEAYAIQQQSLEKKLALGPLQGSWSEYKMLIAEDTRANQFLLRRLFEPLSPELVIVSDGREAVDAIQDRSPQAPFDIVLMDMQMPNLDGYEATKMLRQIGYSGWIVAITAAAMAGDAQKCLDAGCDAYVTKPFARKELIQKLDQLLKRPKSAR